MTDPRNKMHDKRVQQEKKHRHIEGKPGASGTVQPGKKAKLLKQQDLPVQPEVQAGEDEAKSPENPQ